MADSNSVFFLLIGTYTSGGSEGVYVYKFDTDSGVSEFISTAPIQDPSFLAISHDEKNVYVVSELDNEKASINSYGFNKTSGTLNFLNSFPTEGTAPCYVNVDKSKTHVITANYNGGSISVFGILEDGSLTQINQLVVFHGKSVNIERQDQPHVHCIQFSPDQTHVYATDLGMDVIHKFDVNTNNGDYLFAGTPSEIKIEAGYGPRHFTFHPNNKFAYLINELSGQVVAFHFNNGDLEQIGSYEADQVHAGGSADIHIHPNGKYLYSSNRLSHDGISQFEINEETGELTFVRYFLTFKKPRNFVIAPNGKFLLVACQDSDIIQVLSIDDVKGYVNDTGKGFKVSMPVCLIFAHTGKGFKVSNP